jgi:nucleoside 2-deoxyribosyltransferase
MQVFISSTCYDLIDLRAELAEFFRQGGIEPILSDDMDSEFEPQPTANSIESCLANLRKSDAVVIVLSKRYGRSLKDKEYPDVSATHLEYLEAIKRKKPIYMYVRDKLDADYMIWKKNGFDDKVQLAWVDAKNLKLLKFLRDHRELADKDKTNWLWPFRSSAELKRRLSRDFKESFGRAAAENLFRQGRIPVFEISAVSGMFDKDSRMYHLTFQNLSSAVAIKPVFKILPGDNVHHMSSVLGNKTARLDLRWVIAEYDIPLKWKLTYSVIEGHRFEDYGELTIKSSHQGGSPINFNRIGMQYMGSDLSLLLTLNKTDIIS